MRTQWEVLQARRSEAAAALAAAEDALARWDERLEFCRSTPLGLSCPSCGLPLATELAAAEHFVLPDERLVNLGYCPHRLAREGRLAVNERSMSGSSNG